MVPITLENEKERSRNTEERRQINRRGKRIIRKMGEGEREEK